MATDLTPADLANLRRLLAAATPGPWTVERSRLDDDRSLALSAKAGDAYRWHELATVYCTGVEPELGKPNAALIAALVNAAPALIEMAERAVRDPSAGHPATCRCTACFPG